MRISDWSSDVCSSDLLQELDGFIEGLFNGEDVIDLPERAHEAVDRLAEMRAMMAGICELVSHAPDADDAAKLGTTFSHLRALTRIMETEINQAVSSFTRARRHLIEGILTDTWSKEHRERNECVSTSKPRGQPQN